MIAQSTRYFVFLGIAGGLALATAPSVRADIPITGGQMSGDAAFFAPRPTTGTTTGTSLPMPMSPVLFDAAVRTLQLQTPNGTTSTARFMPSAGSFKDVNSNGRADAMDTGVLKGALSGVAFSSAGRPVFFQGIPTQISFTLNSFTPNNLIGGTLISPTTVGEGQLVFLPITGVTLSSSSATAYKADPGTLSVGTFDAKVTGDFIGLPSDLKFQETSSSVLPPTESMLGRRVKFELQGTGTFPTNAMFTETSTSSNTSTASGSGTTSGTASGNTANGGNTTTAEADLNPLDGKISVGSKDAVTEFKIQSIGTQASKEFKIEGTATGVNVEVAGINSSEQKNALSFQASAPTTFKVEGKGVGITSQISNSSVGFNSTNSETKFKFEQASTGYKLEGQSAGSTKFNVGVVGSSMTQYTPTASAPSSTNYSTTTTTTTTGGTATGGTATGGTTTGGTATGGTATGGTATGGTTTGGTATGGTATGSTATGGTTTTGSTTNLNTFSFSTVSSTTTYIRVFTLTSLSSTSGVTYTIFQQNQPTEVEVQRGKGDKILLVRHNRGRGLARGRNTSEVVAVFQQVGPGSRLFPGLVGLQQLPVTEAISTTSSTETDSTSTTSETTSTTTETSTTSTTTNTAPSTGTTTP